MELRSVIRVSNNLYQGEISLDTNGGVSTGLTPVETEAINNFGAPAVDIGGDFGTTGTTGATGSNTYFHIPNNVKYFPTNFPVKQTFSLADFPMGTTAPPNAAVRINVWATEVIARITTAVQEKRAESSLYVGSTVFNVDTTP